LPYNDKHIYVTALSLANFNIPYGCNKVRIIQNSNSTVSQLKMSGVIFYEVILLITQSLVELQRLFHICKLELKWSVMRINTETVLFVYS